MKPSQSSVLFSYTCPKCGSEWWYNFDELRFTSGVKCGCGQILNFTPITDIKVKIKYSQGHPLSEPKIISPQTVDNKLKENGIVALMILGYKKSIATSIVTRILLEHSPQTEAELIELCFKK